MRTRASLVAALLLLAGCERNAPGPAECVALADVTFGPRAPRASYENLVRECLTTPFDYALLACVERTGALRACQQRLQRRRLVGF